MNEAFKNLLMQAYEQADEKDKFVLLMSFPTLFVKPGTSKKCQEINDIWMGKCKQILNARNAAIIFAFGMDKQRRVTVWATQDLLPSEIAEELKKIIKILFGQ